MSIVADEYEYVIGVDTHARTHTYAILTATTGSLVDTATFATSNAGIARAIDWAARRTAGPVLAAVEGTSSYGATLTRALTETRIPVCEAKPPKRQSRAGHGKSDTIDAIAAARTVLAQDTSTLINPRANGPRAALRVLLAARKTLDTRRTADRNTLTALLRSFTLGIDARTPITDTQITQIAAWRPRTHDDPATATIRGEAHRLAESIHATTGQLDTNRAALTRHVDTLAAGLRDIPGIGPVTAAIILTAYSHKGRIRTEAAFAHLAGVAPIPASSGNTTRHRLNRHGDRQLNRALDIITRVRLSYDPDTRAYLTRRTAEGKTRREIRRTLKRYIARSIYRKLNTLTT